MRESASASHILDYSAQVNVLLWRNNVGALTDLKTGRFVRFGLCNETKAQNEHMKSSDYIGITPILITPQLVGRTVGIFTAVETKHSDWVYRGNKREEAQARYISLVQQYGAYAGFARDINDFKQIVGIV